MRTASLFFSRVRTAALAAGAGAGLLASAGTYAQAPAPASGPCTLAGTADLSQVAGLPAAATLVVAGYAPTAADPYQHRPVWQAAFAYAGQDSLAYRAEHLPAGPFVVFSFLDTNANGLFEPAEKLARIAGTVVLSGTTSGATINYPEDCSFYTPGWTALDYFTQNPRPNFNPATTLPYLTKWTWEESDTIQLEMGANWRYAVSVNVHGETEYPGGDRPLVAALIAAPGRYKVQSAATFGDYNFPEFRNGFPSAHLYDSVTNVRSNGVSPAAPDSVFKFLGQKWADDFAGVRKVYPGFQVDYLLNGAESGMTIPVWGHAGGTGPWDRDPAVQRDKRAWDAQFGYDNDWFRYSSDRSAQQNAWVNNTAKAGFAAAQGLAPTLTHYGAGYGFHSGRYYSSYQWGGDYADARKYGATDYSACQFYYGPDGFNNGMGYLNLTVKGAPIGLINNYAGMVQYGPGQRISKPYLSCGWNSGDNNVVSPPDRWMGLLKFAGLCGGVAPTVSNFDEYTETGPQRLDGAVVANDNHIQWIWQYFVSSHAHAAFTHLEDYITGGELVADPAKTHPYNQDPYFPTQPLYLFIPEGEYDPGQPGCADTLCTPFAGGEGIKAAVLARKLDGQAKYLVLAWATTGDDRMVNVDLPGLGPLALYARAAGTIYQIEGTGAARTLEVLDPGAMNPAACLGAPATAAIPDPVPVIGAGTGLAATYYNATYNTPDPNTPEFLSGPAALQRIDATVDFNWERGSPDPALNADFFSARWTGQVLAPVSGSYTFAATADDGARLWVNGQLLVDNWTPTNNGLKTVGGRTVVLVAGQKYDIRLEYYEFQTDAVCRLQWAYAGQALQAIPQSQLFPDTANPASAKASAKASATRLGTAAASGANDFSLYPNPAINAVTLVFSVSSAQPVDIAVLDLAGRTVQRLSHSATVGSNTVSLPLHLAKGVYSVSVQNATARTVRKLVVE